MTWHVAQYWSDTWHE